MIVNLKDIHHSYDSREVISGFSLSIRKEEIVCIIGPSGCGKTTLLNLISGQLRPTSGTVQHFYNRLSYVFQEDRLLPWKNVSENISIVAPEASVEALQQVIDLVDLTGFEQHRPRQLSGGMRQRVSIARGFFFPAELLLMDEPLKSLDYSLRMNMLKSIMRLAEHEKRTLIYVTHEIDEALMLADRIIVLSRCPTRITDEIRIDTARFQRDLQGVELTAARNRIIGRLCEYHQSLHMERKRG